MTDQPKAPSEQKHEAMMAREAEKAAIPRGPRRKEWRDVLKGSTAWASLSDEYGVSMTDEGFEGPEDLHPAHARRVLALADTVLATAGYRVDGTDDPLTAAVREA